MTDNGTMTIEELLGRIEAARDTMSERNPHRHLFEQCRVAIVFLASRLPEPTEVRSRGGIIMP